MIMVMKRSNLVFIAVIFVLSLALIGLNHWFVKNGEASENPSASMSATPAPTPANLIGTGKTVLLDPGHGGEDPGAVSDYNGVSEKNINLYIATQVKDLLEADGYTVMMTRTEDVLVYDETAKGETAMRRQDLLRRKKMMDESGADIVVSIHLNKYTDPDVHGAQTFFVKDSKSSEKLAVCLQTAIVSKVDPENTRVALVKKEDIIITKNCKTTTAIVECGFLSNKEEEAKLSQQTYQDALAAAIKLGIDNYFTA